MAELRPIRKCLPLGSPTSRRGCVLWLDRRDDRNQYTQPLGSVRILDIPPFDI